MSETTEPKGIQKYKAAVFKSYVVLTMFVFGILTFLAKQYPYFSIDTIITKAIQRFNPVWFDTTMKWVSFLGSNPQVILIVTLTAAFLFLIKLRWESIISVISATLATTVGIIIKNTVHRPRPSANLIHVFSNLRDASFPSGHVLLYTVFFGFLLFLSYTLLKKSFKRNILITIFAILIILIGPSRIYLGEHWASDVLGAYLLGSVLLIGVIYLYRGVKQ